MLSERFQEVRTLQNLLLFLSPEKSDKAEWKIAKGGKGKREHIQCHLVFLEYDVYIVPAVRPSSF